MEINEIILRTNLTNEILKQAGLIRDYKTVFVTKNYSIDSDGRINFDLIVTNTIIPNTPIKHINVNINLKKNKLS